MVEKFAIRKYLGSSMILTAYGASAFLVLVLVWYIIQLSFFILVRSSQKCIHAFPERKIILNYCAVQIDKEQSEIEPKIVNVH